MGNEVVEPLAKVSVPSGHPTEDKWNLLLPDSLYR